MKTTSGIKYTPHRSGNGFYTIRASVAPEKMKIHEENLDSSLHSHPSTLLILKALSEGGYNLPNDADKIVKKAVKRLEEVRLKIDDQNKIETKKLLLKLRKGTFKDFEKTMLDIESKGIKLTTPDESYDLTCLLNDLQKDLFSSKLNEIKSSVSKNLDYLGPTPKHNLHTSRVSRLRGSNGKNLEII